VKGLLLLTASLVAACAASAAAPPVRLQELPGSIAAGKTWTAVLLTARAGVPTLRAQLGRRTVTSRGRRLRAHRYRARLRFPAAGTWNLSAVLGRRRVGLGSIVVTPAPYLLDQPAQALALDDGSLLVTERGSKDRVLQIDLATGRFRVFATGVNDPFGLAHAPDGSILISSDSGIFRVSSGGGRAALFADVPASPILPLAGGDVYYGHSAELGRIDASAQIVERFPVEVNAPHAIAFAPDGDLIVSDTGNNRVVRVDLPSRQPSVLVADLRAPVGMIAEPGGTFLLLEFERGALTRIDESGRTATVATGLDTPYALTRAADGMVYVAQVGDRFSPTGRIRRVAPDGSVSTRTLIRP
jgi:sugar lactone lactonase YvrE